VNFFVSLEWKEEEEEGEVQWWPDHQ